MAPIVDTRVNPDGTTTLSVTLPGDVAQALVRPVEAAVRAVLDAAGALRQSSARGVVHLRDVAPPAEPMEAERLGAWLREQGVPQEEIDEHARQVEEGRRLRRSYPPEEIDRWTREFEAAADELLVARDTRGKPEKP